MVDEIDFFKLILNNNSDKNICSVKITIKAISTLVYVYGYVHGNGHVWFLLFNYDNAHVKAHVHKNTSSKSPF